MCFPLSFLLVWLTLVSCECSWSVCVGRRGSLPWWFWRACAPFLRRVNLCVCVCVVNGVVRHCTKAGHTRLETKKKESHSVGLVLTDFPLDLSNPQQASPDTVYNPPWLADDFVDAITDDPKVSSFNVTSLFTSIPLQLALQVVLRPPSTNDTANHLFSQTTLYGPTTPLSDLDLLFVQL